MGAVVRNFKELKVWQMAFALSCHVYELTAGFPTGERFGLTSQLRRAVVSIPSNIAEGYNRGSRCDYVRYLQMAKGSAAEVETQLLIARALRFAIEARLDKLLGEIAEIERILETMVRSLSPVETT